MGTWVDPYSVGALRKVLEGLPDDMILVREGDTTKYIQLFSEVVEAIYDGDRLWEYHELDVQEGDKILNVLLFRS